MDAIIVVRYFCYDEVAALPPWTLRQKHRICQTIKELAKMSHTVQILIKTLFLVLPK